MTQTDLVRDAQGNPMSGASAEATRHYEAAATAFHLFRGDPVGEINAAIAAAPTFVMAHVLKAWLYALATEPAATTKAKKIVAAASDLSASAREQSHITALKLLLDNEWTAAAVALDRHQMLWPHDLAALQAGHLADFYRANARDLRDRVARTLPQWSDDMPGYSIVLGMYSFGLEEAGDYAQAEDVGREATERQPLDCWAHHAVAHVLEMQGRAADGIDWMASREPHWSGDSNFFQVHNWWHKALYHMDLSQLDEALALYDTRVHAEPSDVALDLVDASALLWRLTLAGQAVGDRWHDVANAWDAHADGKLYPFNDWHASMAYLGAGRDGEVDRILATYQNSGDEETALWARQTGAELIEGFRDFWRADYEAAALKLHRARYIANHFGGSHAQRDVIDWTATEAAVRSKVPGLARAMASERLALKPHSPMNQLFLSRAEALREEAPQ